MDGTVDLFCKLIMPLIVTCFINIGGCFIERKEKPLLNGKIDSGLGQKGIETKSR